MATTITVPREYGYVVATTAFTFFLGAWHGMRIGFFRKAAGVGYPKFYADSGDMASASAEKKKQMYLFNCAQRAHGNYNENHPSVAIAMLLTGLRYPIATTVMGVAWSVGRLVYALGYTKKDGSDGKGRLYGSFFWLPQFALFGLAGWCGVKMVL
ncbi:hypothetical protein LTR37_005037 [Vermiconidia calcicola]|uniref:Uncharacterized protein n=1 Tax=Vermiconidia calcicola TaxID=1690605 RepID=A0ACC3NLN4_9PEZI|nr:hypothetical protein LTR37_005037 [Vermiconidia calcicola]